jgi:hypothetical protein
MIKNEKQYQVTRQKLQGIREQNMRIQEKELQSVTDRLILASGLYMQQELENEVMTYVGSLGQSLNNLGPNQ